MMRALLKPLHFRAAALNSPIPRAPTVARCFAAAAAKKPKLEDGTLEGRYATALFMASSGRLDQVQGDLTGLKTMMNESKDFKLLIETPGIDPESKIEVLQSVCKKAGSDAAVVNFLKVLIENKRLHLLSKMIDMFDAFYRAEKGHVLCKVTSANALSSSAQAEVKKAMEARAAKGSTLIMEWDVNPALMGGLVVKMGEAVYDFSVSSRLERLQTQLMAPLV
eukprot:TRINITY_DN445_c0_g1_i1.p1 TRINITY_DN445_c0_g1~~TRINITY_DN445_c0_g1_i1.p1  ORF type:complete len:247 (+),score=47.62 TRINITY_DN445_c0_g1_i1:78-743(+)